MTASNGGMTPGELQRRIADLASTTLRKDVYDADQRTRAAERLADGAQVHALEQDVSDMREQSKWNRRLIITGLVYPMVVGAILLIFQTLVHR